MKIYFKQLHWQIFIAMIFGLIVGSYINLESSVYTFIITLGVIFIKLLKMITIPLIFTSILTGITNISSFNKLGRIGLKTISYYLLTSLFAIVIGLGLTNWMQPGVFDLKKECSLNAELIEEAKRTKIDIEIVENIFCKDNVTEQACEMYGTGFSELGKEVPLCEWKVTNGIFNSNNTYDYEKLNTPDSTLDIFIRMIPENPISAAVSGDMLSIIFFTILLGIAITRLPVNHKKNLTTFFESLFQAIMNLTQMVIKLSPIGVFGLIVKTVSTSNIELFYSIGKYMLTIAIGLSIHIFIVLPILFFLITGINPLKHFKAMSSAMATAFSTSSSSSTLPVTIKCVNENVKASKEVSGFVLPMGATINMDGTALYECAGVIFISQILGVELTISQQIIVVITALLASIGAAGIPSAGLVMIFIVTQAVGFSNEDVALIIGAMLAVDRPLDMFRTMVNVTSDSIGTAIIAHSEGEELYN